MGCSLSPGISRLHDPDLAFERRISRLESLRSLFTASAEVSFADKYTLETTVLGKGAFGEVYEAISKDLEEKVAVKIIPKKVVDDLTKLKLEVKILKTLKHENILVLYDFFQQDDNYIIVTELIRGGPLTKRLADKKSYTEKDARDLFVSLTKVVGYLHKNDIVHRDLKLDNILLKSADNDHEIKIIDFGIATFCSRPFLTNVIGTLPYMAPEVLSAKMYGKPVDIWALGCILFTLLAGKVPFHHENKNRIVISICDGKYEFNPVDWHDISFNAKDLIRGILQVDVKKRFSIAHILAHPWCKTEDHELQQRTLERSQSHMKLHSELNANKDIFCESVAASTMKPEDMYKELQIVVEFTKERNASMNRLDSPTASKEKSLKAIRVV